MAIEHVELNNKVALVTGGRRGIGRAILKRLAAAGASVVFAAESAGDERVDETIDWFKQAGIPLGFLEFDLADETARADAIARAGAFFGPVDILVNNAATGGHGTRPSTIALGDRRRILEVNLHAPIDLIQQALPHMLEQGWGRIVNLGSETMREVPIPYSAPEENVRSLVFYGTSKAALSRYTQGLAGELHGTGVTANIYYPYKVAVTEQNSDRALQALRLHPDWAEGLEVMAEAAYLLIAGGFTGLSLGSREIIAFNQQPLHALDGRTVIGDARTTPSLDAGE